MTCPEAEEIGTGAVTAGGDAARLVPAPTLSMLILSWSQRKSML